MAFLLWAKYGDLLYVLFYSFVSSRLRRSPSLTEKDLCWHCCLPPTTVRNLTVSRARCLLVFAVQLGRFVIVMQ